MKIISITLIPLVFITCGILFDKYDVITSPAYWALYGVFFGSINTIAWMGED